MNGPAKILAVDDEADFELLLRQRFRRQIRTGEPVRGWVHRSGEVSEPAAAVRKHDPLVGLGHDSRI